MANIKIKDLENIPTNYLKDFMQCEDVTLIKNEYLKNICEKSKDNYELSNTINRIENLIFQEITRRWLRDELIENLNK